MMPLAHAALAAALAAADPNVAYHDLGPVPANAKISVALVIAYRNEDELRRLVTLQSRPQSPYYHRWLTSRQFNSAFGPSVSDYSKAIASLRRAGFVVNRTFPNRTVIDATADVATVDRYFDTEIARVYEPGYGVRYANIKPAFIPADLRGVLFAVTGLHDLDLAFSRAGRRNAMLRPAMRDAVAAKLRLLGPTNTASGLNGYGPVAFSDGYDFPSRHRKAYSGSGRVAAILSNGDFSETDLKRFLTYFRVKRTGPATVRVAVDEATVGVDPVTTGEAENLIALAPGTSLYMYETGTSATDITDALNRIVSDNKADVVDVPYSQCETSDTAATTSWDDIAQQGAALGMTFEADVLDAGICALPAPASSPNFVAIGGTALVVSDSGAYEAELAAGGDIFNEYSGGASAVFSLPAWQENIPNVIATGRNIPDVAFNAGSAGFQSPFSVYYGGTWQTASDPSLGTEFANSIFAAALTEINQIEGERLGLIAPTLYSLWTANGYQNGSTVYFHDITEGYVPTKVGYDQNTGIGSMDIWNLATLLKK
jgi:subtilase family serine protease